MKGFKLLPLLVCAAWHTQAYNEVTHTWYASPLGNNAVIQTTFGCIDAGVMFERHEVKANTWDGQWKFSIDAEFNFKFFNQNQYPTSYPNAPLMTLHSSQLHDENGRTIDDEGNDIAVVLYSLRPYEPINQRAENVSTRGWVFQEPQCHTRRDSSPIN